MVEVVAKQVVLCIFQTFFFVIYLIVKASRLVIEIQVLENTSQDSFIFGFYEFLYTISIVLRDAATVAPVICIWLSFIFAQKEYLKFCKTCHDKGLNFCVIRARKNVTKVHDNYELL